MCFVVSKVSNEHVSITELPSSKALLYVISEYSFIACPVVLNLIEITHKNVRRFETSFLSTNLIVHYPIAIYFVAEKSTLVS